MAIRWLLKCLIIPPAPMILILVLALLIWRWRPRAAQRLVILATLLLWAFSTPVVVTPAVQWLQDIPPAAPEAVASTQAIVILGGGRIPNAREWVNTDQVNRHTLVRIRYGAHLARETGLPVMISAGGGSGQRPPEATLMRQALSEYGVTPQWVENKSRTTRENASYSAEILLAKGIKRITLVTQSFHMRRAKTAFERAGFEVVPAATDYLESTDSARSWASWALEWVPNIYSAREMGRVVYECLGMAVYWLQDSFWQGASGVSRV